MLFEEFLCQKNDEMRHQKDMGYQSQFPMFPIHRLRSLLTLHLWNRVSVTFFPLFHPYCRHRCLPRAAHLRAGEAGVDSGSSPVSSPRCSSSLLPASSSSGIPTVPPQARPLMSFATPCRVKITCPPTTSSQKNCNAQSQKQRLLRSSLRTKSLHALTAQPTTLCGAQQPASNLFMPLRV